MKSIDSTIFYLSAFGLTQQIVWDRLFDINYLIRVHRHRSIVHTHIQLFSMPKCLRLGTRLEFLGNA